jgi:GntR family transcriptional regulator
MLLNLSDQSEETLQDQLIRQVRAQILTGDLPEGSELPSIRSLAREQKVSVITVQRGYEALEQAGLIRARRGKGFFVLPLGAARKQELAALQLQAQLIPALEQARAEGLSAAIIRQQVDAILDGVPA